MRLLRASDSSLSPGNSNQPHFLRRREVTWVIAPPPSLQRAVRRHRLSSSPEAPAGRGPSGSCSAMPPGLCLCVPSLLHVCSMKSPPRHTPAQAVSRTNPDRDRRGPSGACTVLGACPPAAFVVAALSLKSSWFGCRSGRRLLVHRDWAWLSLKPQGP